MRLLRRAIKSFSKATRFPFGRLSAESDRLTIASRVGPATRAIRSRTAPLWRRLIRIVLIVAGLALFGLLEVMLAFGIIKWNSYWFLILMCGVIAAATAIAFYRPVLMFAVWLILLPWTWFFPIHSARLYLNFDILCLSLITLVAFARFLVGRKHLHKLCLAEWILLLNIVYCTVWPVFRLYSDKLGFTLLGHIWQILLAPAVVYFIAKMCMETKRQVRFMVLVLVGIGALWTLSAFYEHHTGYQWHSILTGNYVRLQWRDVGLGRAIGPANGQVVPGTVLCAAFLVLFHILGFVRNAFAKAALYALSLGMVLAVYFTYTRTSYSAFVAAIALMCIVARGRRVRYGVFVGACLLVTALALPTLMSNEQFYVRMTDPANLISRQATIATGLNVVRDNFWFGVGWPDDLILRRYVSSRYHQRVSGGQELQTIDNDFLFVLVSNGIFGFCFHIGSLLAFLFYLFRIRSVLPEEGITGGNFAASTIAYVAVMFVSMIYTQLQTSPYLYYLMFVFFAINVRLMEIHGDEQALQTAEAHRTARRQFAAPVPAMRLTE